jgi:hypothetical protein
LSEIFSLDFANFVRRADDDNGRFFKGFFLDLGDFLVHVSS